jgi:ubiquinone/menaquinone biosynthesis C-methylase UbiE
VTADVVASAPPPGTRVLDIGTGPGRVPIALARALPQIHVEGLDLSAEMIGHARRHVREARVPVEFTIGDVADLPYPDDSFDLVVSSMSQHHWPDPAAGMRELSRILRPDGQAWIYDIRFAMGRAEHAARAAFPAHDIRRELVRIGHLPIRLVGRLTIKQP